MINIGWIYFVNITIYVLAIAAVISCLSREYYDLYLGGPDRNIPGTCNVYVSWRPLPDDSPEELRRKIRMLGQADLDTVKWRRALLISIISSFIILFVILQRPPWGWELLLSSFILYFIIYMSFEFYQNKITIPVSQNITQALNQL